jgi:hypothetical protein
MKLHIGSLLVAIVMFAGCSAYNTEPKSVVLPSSNRSIDLVQHRSDVRFTDCGTLTVLQTYDNAGKLIDSKEARGSALHCVIIPAVIEAGGRVGAGFASQAASTVIRNVNQQAQGQLQGQSQTSINANTNVNSNTTTGGIGGAGGAGGNGGNGGNGGQGGQGGNNGGGNGSDDGTNNGTDHHHENGDNS